MKQFTIQKYPHQVFDLRNKIKKHFDILTSKDEAKNFIENDIFMVIDNAYNYSYLTLKDQDKLKEAKVNSNVILKFKECQLWYCIQDGKSHYWAKLK